MDWKLEQKRQEKKRAIGKVDSARDVNIVGEMERGFSQIFGGMGNPVFVSRCRQAGDPVRRTELSNQTKGAKAN